MKNLTIFRSTAGWVPNLEGLNENLSVPGKLGYSWKVLREGLPYIRVGDNIFLTVEHQKKLVPSSVVNAELKLRLQNFESAQGFKPGKTQTKEIKEGILIEFAAKAFVTSKLINVWINTKENLLCIETTSNAIVEDIIPLLIRNLGFTGRSLDTERLPIVFMTTLIIDGVDREFECGNSCVLQDIAGGKFIAYKNENLDTEEVATYFKTGKMPEKLEISFKGGLTYFTLNKNLVISKISIMDKEINKDSYETPEDYFDSEFAIRAGTCIEIINALLEVLGEQKLIEEKDAA